MISILLVSLVLVVVAFAVDRIERRIYGRTHTTGDNLRYYQRQAMSRGWDGPTSYDAKAGQYRRWGAK